MEFLSELFKQLAGQDATVANVLASFLKFMLGASIIFVLDLSFRDPSSSRTPSAFSVKFLWADNKLRFLRTFLLGVLFLIAGGTFVAISGIVVPEEWANLLPVFAGLSSDGIALTLKRRFIGNSKQTDDAPESSASQTTDNENTKP